MSRLDCVNQSELTSKRRSESGARCDAIAPAPVTMAGKREEASAAPPSRVHCSPASHMSSAFPANDINVAPIALLSVSLRASKLCSRNSTPSTTPPPITAPNRSWAPAPPRPSRTRVARAPHGKAPTLPCYENLDLCSPPLLSVVPTPRSQHGNARSDTPRHLKKPEQANKGDAGSPRHRGEANTVNRHCTRYRHHLPYLSNFVTQIYSEK